MLPCIFHCLRVFIILWWSYFGMPQKILFYCFSHISLCACIIIITLCTGIHPFSRSMEIPLYMSRVLCILHLQFHIWQNFSSQNCMGKWSSGFFSPPELSVWTRESERKFAAINTNASSSSQVKAFYAMMGWSTSGMCTCDLFSSLYKKHCTSLFFLWCIPTYINITFMTMAFFR